LSLLSTASCASSARPALDIFIGTADHILRSCFRLTAFENSGVAALDVEGIVVCINGLDTSWVTGSERTV
jgi:hypothetical protein